MRAARDSVKAAAGLIAGGSKGRLTKTKTASPGL